MCMHYRFRLLVTRYHQALNNIKFSLRERQAHYDVFLSLGGAASGRVTPGPIPNPEVKPPSADDTAPSGRGNVGQRHPETLYISIYYTSFNPIQYFHHGLSLYLLSVCFPAFTFA